jgi:hypothetical protein
VTHTNFQEKLSNGSRRTAEKVNCASNKAASIFDRSHQGYTVLANVGGAPDMNFRGIRSSGRRDSRKGTLIILYKAVNYWTMSTKLSCFVANVPGLADKKLLEDPAHGSRDTVEKVQFCTRKVSLIFNRSHKTIRRLKRMCTECHAQIRRKIHKSGHCTARSVSAGSNIWYYSVTPPFLGEIGRKTVSAWRVKCPSLLTDFNIACTACSEWAGSIMWYYSVTALQS